MRFPHGLEHRRSVSSAGLATPRSTGSPDGEAPPETPRRNDCSDRTSTDVSGVRRHKGRRGEEAHPPCWRRPTVAPQPKLSTRTCGRPRRLPLRRYLVRRGVSRRVDCATLRAALEFGSQLELVCRFAFFLPNSEGSTQRNSDCTVISSR
jgi:hypothetical protein